MDVLHVFVYPLALMGIMGGAFGVLLAIASVVFHVHQDERIGLIRAALPGANCGGCGYPGCDGYASGVVEDGAKTNLCSVGGAAVAAKVAEIMGVAAEASVPMRAFLKCKGTLQASPRAAIYDGVLDCRSAVIVPGGSPNECPFGCVGFGTCAKVCPFGAISMGADGLPKIDLDACVGCGVCVADCPKAVLALVPRSADVIVACASNWKGPMVRDVCSAGCIGCGVCAKVCPAEAITIERDLATIDQGKCVKCGRCAAKCPAKCISTNESCDAPMEQTA